jgi:hypothetical protein
MGTAAQAEFGRERKMGTKRLGGVGRGGKGIR